MSSAVVGPSTGWGVLHLFARLGPAVDHDAVVAAVKATQAEDHQVVTFAVLGHKADVGFLALGPDLWCLRDFQGVVQRAGLALSGSYVSLTEVSEYARGMPQAALDARLHPRLPPEGKRAIAFYPMSKRRTEGRNWYALSYEEREALMRGHGAVGRTFAGRVLQLITASTGLDDYEWGVTLFGSHPDDLKDAVYTMRFDQGSAHYADFGPFYTGLVGDVEEVMSRVGRP